MLKELIDNRDILLIACGPSINNLDHSIFKKNIFVVLLNNSFLKFHGDCLFFADLRFFENYKNLISKEIKLIIPNTLEKTCKDYNIIHIYNPSKDLYRNNLNTLLAGYSVVIPAIDFCCKLCNKLYIAGLEMENRSHWDKTNLKTFPGKFQVLNKILQLQLYYKDVEFNYV